MRSISVAVAQRYLVVETNEHSSTRWRVEVVGYTYVVASADGPEILSYHWHSEDAQLVRSPHLHLGPGAQIGREELHKAHLPTGPVGLADVIRLLITDFGAPPRRADWTQILDTRAEG
jgi:hypothetical protein